MKTCQFKNTEVLTLVQMVAEKWYMAKVYTLAPVHERCWNHPVPTTYQNTPAGRLKYRRVKEAQAAEYRSILLALGVPSLPTLDATMYVSEARGGHTKAGDLQFMLGGDKRREYRDGVLKAITLSALNGTVPVS